jgi:hypothetical protein
MVDILNCLYMEKYTDFQTRDNTEGIKVIQMLGNNGKILAGGKYYPVSFGGLLFIGDQKNYSVIPDEDEKYSQNSIVISKTFLNTLAELLDFKKELEEIFFNTDIYFRPVKHYKVIDSRFKKMSGLYNSKNKFSKALFTAKFIELLNYAVFSISKS